MPSLKFKNYLILIYQHQKIQNAFLTFNEVKRLLKAVGIRVTVVQNKSA